MKRGKLFLGVLLVSFCISISIAHPKGVEASFLTYDNSVEESEITALVGETGTLTPPQPLDGIVLQWEFEEINDNEYVRLDANGRWYALKSGSTDITPFYHLSQHSLDRLEKENIEVEIVNLQLAWSIFFTIEPPLETSEINEPVTKEAASDTPNVHQDDVDTTMESSVVIDTSTNSQTVSSSNSKKEEPGSSFIFVALGIITIILGYLTFLLRSKGN